MRKYDHATLQAAILAVQGIEGPKGPIPEDLLKKLEEVGYEESVRLTVSLVRNDALGAIRKLLEED